MKPLFTLREASHALKPVLRIGKNGLTEGQCQEIIRQLKKKKLIKIKLLKSFLQDQDKKELAQLVAKKVGAELVEVIGFVITLYRK